MKNILLYFFLLITITVSAQRQLPFYNTAAGTLTQTGAGSGYVDVRINYSDQTGMTTGIGLDNTCVLLYFNTDESIGYELPVLSITTPSSTNPVVRVNITGFPALNGSINGQGVIYKKTSSKHLAPFVSNASNSLQQVIQEAMARDLNDALIAGVDITKYIGSGAPLFTPASNEPKLAQGLTSPYPFYAYNGSAWVLVGSGGSSATQAINGLTKTGDTIKLGGVLTAPTTITTTLTNIIKITGLSTSSNANSTGIQNSNDQLMMINGDTLKKIPAQYFVTYADTANIIVRRNNPILSNVPYTTGVVTADSVMLINPSTGIVKAVDAGSISPKEFGTGSGLSATTVKDYYINTTDTTAARKIANNKYELLEVKSYTPPVDTVIGSNTFYITKNTRWFNTGVISGKSIEFAKQNDGTFKKVGKWTNTDFGIKGDGTDRTTEIQSMFNVFQQKGIKAEISIDSSVRFNSCLLTSTPKHCIIEYYGQSDLCRPTIYSNQVTSERKVFVNGGDNDGAVSEHVFEGGLNPGLFVNAKPSWGGNTQNLVGSQTMRSPARASFLMGFDNTAVFQQKIERADTTAARGGVSIDAMSFGTFTDVFTLNGVGSGNLSGVVVNDRVIGQTSGCIGIVKQVYADSLILYWRYGRPLDGGEKWRITHTNTISSTNHTSFSNRKSLSTVAWNVDDITGANSSWMLPYNNAIHRTYFGKGIAIMPSYDGSRTTGYTNMVQGDAPNDVYIVLSGTAGTAVPAQGKSLYYSSGGDYLEFRDYTLGSSTGKMKVTSTTVEMINGTPIYHRASALSQSTRIVYNPSNVAVMSESISGSGGFTQTMTSSAGTSYALFDGNVNQIRFGNAPYVGGYRFLTKDNNLFANGKTVINGLNASSGTNSFEIHNSTGTNNTFIASDDGKICIGCLTPTYKLDIDAKTGSAGNPLRLQGVLQGSTSDSIATLSSGIIKQLSIAQVNNVAYTTAIPQLEFKATSAVTTTGTTSITLTKITGSPDIPASTDFSHMHLYFKGIRQIHDIGVSTRDFKVTSATSTTVVIDFYTVSGTKEIAVDDYFTIDIVR